MTIAREGAEGAITSNYPELLNWFLIHTIIISRWKRRTKLKCVSLDSYWRQLSILIPYLIRYITRTRHKHFFHF